MPPYRLALLATVVLCIHPAQARDPALLPADAVRAAQILAAPAPIGSAALAQELALMHRIEQARTPAQAERALADDADESILLFTPALRAAFQATNLPLTAALSAKVKGDAALVGSPAKQAFQRAHPYQTDATLKPVCPTKTRQDSYPSGRTLAAYLQALVPIDLVPQQRDAVLQRAADYAHNRVVCGVNYPSDLEASRLLAYSAAAVLRQQPAYQQEADAARNEVRRLLGLPLTTR